jgi:hypothetical protein
VNILRIGFFVYEYPPAIVGGLSTYAENATQEYVDIGHDDSVFTLNGGNLKTREILRGVEVHRPLINDASNVFPFFVVDDLKKWVASEKTFPYSLFVQLPKKTNSTLFAVTSTRHYYCSGKHSFSQLIISSYSTTHKFYYRIDIRLVLTAEQAKIILNYLVTKYLEYSGGIMVTKDAKIERVDAEIDEIAQRILLELESASAKDLTDAR